MLAENGNGIEFSDEEKESSNFEDGLLQNLKKRKLQVDVIDDRDENLGEIDDEDIYSYCACSTGLCMMDASVGELFKNNTRTDVK